MIDTELLEAKPSATSCTSCAAANAGLSALPTPVFALGQVEPRLTRASVEREFAAVLGRFNSERMLDQQAFHKVISDRSNRYLARNICWVLTVRGIDAYVLLPRDPVDFDALIGSVQPIASSLGICTVIGWKGPLSDPTRCGGLAVPVVSFEQLLSFRRDEFIGALPLPEGKSAEEFSPLANELLDRILQLADNTGATNEHRALNYLVMRHPPLFETTARCYDRGFSLRSVDVKMSRLSGTRSIVDTIFVFKSRAGDADEAYFARVDVSDIFPFIVTRLSPYFDR